MVFEPSFTSYMVAMSMVTLTILSCDQDNQGVGTPCGWGDSHASPESKSGRGEMMPEEGFKPSLALEARKGYATGEEV